MFVLKKIVYLNIVFIVLSLSLLAACFLIGGFLYLCFYDRQHSQ